MVQDRHAGLRTDRLDPDARLWRSRPPPGTRAAGVADLRRGPALRPRRPLHAAAPGPALPRPRPDHRFTRLYAWRPADQQHPHRRPGGTSTALWNPLTRHASRTTRHAGHPSSRPPPPRVSEPKSRRIEA